METTEPSIGGQSNNHIEKSILQKDKSENIIQQRVTQVAQNTRHDQKVVDDFISYVNV